NTQINSEIPNEVQPGFLDSIVDVYSKNVTDANVKYHNLSVDLKKIITTRSKDGSIDLHGFEPAPTKTELFTSLEADLTQIKDLGINADKLRLIAEDSNAYDLIKGDNRVLVENIIKEIKGILLVQADKLKKLRNLTSAKQFTLKKLMKQALDDEHSKGDWTKTKYAQAISVTKTTILQTKECVTHMLQNIDRCGEICSILQSSKHYKIG
ncbi:unnamed protein product, partial [Owenia fusiformis]